MDSNVETKFIGGQVKQPWQIDAVCSASILPPTVSGFRCCTRWGIAKKYDAALFCEQESLFLANKWAEIMRETCCWKTFFCNGGREEGGGREGVEIEGLNHRFVSKFSDNELKILCFMLLFTKMMVLQLRKFVLNFTVSNF